ncbi:hypothetical protein M8C21_001637 [Ambrosia artemisiifolia]|uniref:Uncharacterized protein n=1 Tax=Ambrosia artemisiifolia TaxID=4212 RepID=A0AAD5C015_AMBAR|nr:hypothetical protein M8C21_001637 [Ambrosia artemisiifolia]
MALRLHGSLTLPRSSEAAVGGGIAAWRCVSVTKTNNKCDLSSIIVLPPHSWFLNLLEVGIEEKERRVGAGGVGLSWWSAVVIGAAATLEKEEKGRMTFNKVDVAFGQQRYLHCQLAERAAS